MGDWYATKPLRFYIYQEIRMKIASTKLILIMSILIFYILTVYADEIIQYELTQDKIEDVWVYEIEGGLYKGLYEVVVELNEPNKEAFSRLTEDNIGKRLMITFAGRVLTSAIIKDKIDSGTILLGKWNSEKEARKFVETLKPKKGKKEKRGQAEKRKKGTG
jgi:hypothetical protein